MTILIEPHQLFEELPPLKPDWMDHDPANYVPVKPFILEILRPKRTKSPEVKT